ncbi:Acg family FMN-binding oxidoreductase [Futiania mangrovi]|uniref:Nitroreductase family protein n=1 Tax=Futiania mangrovi TaxID=2959716 RepID=A0A9J6PEQ7_9PROT|nr:nitroreductase family protein [Futiania mangrovii]MCP1335111.1 nitroreductase family protein [Futiania mangrovii]
MSRQDYAAAAAAIRTPLRVPAGGGLDLEELVRLGTLAANSHNTQPWTFSLEAGAILIRPDPGRRCPVVDPDDAHLWRSLGCAAENIVQGAQAFAHAASVSVDGEVLRIDFTPAEPRAPDALCLAIPRRQCVKTAYDGRPVPAHQHDLLRQAGTVGLARAVLVTDADMRAGIADLVAEGDRAQLDDPAFREELTGWMRFSDATAIRTGDGLSGRTVGQPALPDWLARPLVGLMLSGKAQARTDRRNIESSPVLAVIVAAGEGPETWVDAGRASERFQLQATALGLASAFLNQPVEVPHLRPRLTALLGLADETPQLILRAGYGPEMPYSQRRPVRSVIRAPGADPARQAPPALPAGD